MATMNVSLPGPLKAWVDAQAASGRYGSAGDYVRDLIRRDQERAEALARLDTLVAEGLDSGVSARSLDDLRAIARRRARVAPDR